MYGQGWNAYGTTFQQILNAVGNYYGSGSDQWLAIAQYGMAADNAAGILRQTPGVSYALNESGQVVSWAYDAGVFDATATQAAAAESAALINSNALSVGSQVVELEIPANFVEGAQAGEIAVTSGAESVSTGASVGTVLGHVGTAIAGAAIGSKLGVWIDGALYNAAPDFWDSHNLSELNPETWGSTKVTNWLYDWSGYDDFVAQVDTNGQMYLQQELFALYAQYMAKEGFFDASVKALKEDVPQEDLLDKSVLPDEVPFSYFSMCQFLDPIGQIHTKWTLTSSGAPVKFTGIGQTSAGSYYTWVSDEPFTILYEVPESGIVSTVSSSPVTLPDGQVYHRYYVAANGDFTQWIPADPRHLYLLPEEYSSFGVFVDDLATILALGETATTEPREGVHPYDTMPIGITPDMTIPQILALLEEQYPELFDNAIKNGVIEDDGTITDKIFLPVGMPSGGTETQPQTDPQSGGATDPDNPGQSTFAQTILNPSPVPTPNPDPGEIGEGNTPAIVTPTGSADALYKIYNPTNQQIKDLGAWLWSPNFVDQILKLFSDPMQAIISLHKIYATPHTGGTTDIKVGYLNSGVQSKWVDQQYISVDCGTVSILEKRGDVLDYEPFVDIRLYLPFIGIVPLSPADVLRGKVGVSYKIDVITGTVVASVSIARDRNAGGVIYQYTGSMAENYPLSSGSYMGIVTGVLGIAAGVAGTIATGGAAAPALLGGAAGLTAMHTKIEHSNGFSGNAGALACKKPYFIISRTQGALSDNLAALTGWGSNAFVTLSHCSGYTRVKDINLGVSGATDAELNMIEQQLKEGVII